MTLFNPITPHNKADWQAYVKACQLEAGLALKATIKKDFFQEVTENKWSGTSYRPTYIYQTNYYPDLFSTWWHAAPRQTTVINIEASKPKETTEDKEAREQKERADQAKVIGSILTLTFAFLGGYTLQLAQKQNLTFKATQDAFNACKDIDNLSNQRPVKSKLLQFTRAQMTIDTLNTTKINNYCIAAFGSLVGAATLAWGGFSAKSWLITAGQVALVVSATFAVFNVGIHWGDQEIINTNRQLILGNPVKKEKGLADSILEDLDKHTSELKLSNLDDYQRPPAPTTTTPAQTTSQATPQETTQGYESICPDYYNPVWSDPPAYHSHNWNETPPYSS